jgi:D-serine dehydratase
MSATTIDAATVAALDDEQLGYAFKGLPPGTEGVRLGDVGAQGWHALRDLAMPAMLLLGGPLERNLREMAAWCREQDVLLAPHGKTTMAPQLFARQVEAGCFAITCATPWHLRIYRHFGVGRVLYANELVEPALLAWIAAELARDPGFELYALADSVTTVEAMDRGLLDAPRPVRVLVEMGLPHGRTGCRTTGEAVAVAQAVVAASHLELAGVEGFEGLARAETVDGTIARVDVFLAQVVAAFEAIGAAGLLPDEPLVTAGGSAYFDRVVAAFRPLQARIVVRGGCYVTQDGGFYDQVSPLAGRSGGDRRLVNALEVWGAVVSRPETDFAVASFGRRDVPIDLGLPIAVKVARDGVAREVDGMQVVALSDQHAHLTIPPDLDLVAGDLVGARIIHPCGAFDRWRLLLVVDDDYRVTGGVRTFF